MCQKYANQINVDPKFKNSIKIRNKKRNICDKTGE